MPYKDKNSIEAKEAKKRAYQKWASSPHGKEVLKRMWHNHYLRHKEERDKKSKERSKRLLQKYRKIVIEHYGGKCACCREVLIEFLTIDHPNGNGKEDRKRFRTSYSFYKWLIDSNFPDGYRILCYNCNCSIGHYGYCPHQKL
jgi:hypothetical protein